MCGDDQQTALLGTLRQHVEVALLRCLFRRHDKGRWLRETVRRFGQRPDSENLDTACGEPVQ